MNNLPIFAFEGQQVRLVGTAERPEWVAADVCSILDLNTSEAVNGHKRKASDGTVVFQGGLDEDEKGMVIVHTPGGEQEMLTVNEQGLYHLLSKSRKVIAKRFRRWVFHDVIPSIRKTGSYSVDTATPSPSLPSTRERLEIIHFGIRLFQELGGCDPRTQFLLKDQLRSILLEDKLQPALPGQVEWPISDRAVVLGHRPSPPQLQQIGRKAVRLYQKRHGRKPVQREQFVGGTTRIVNVYSEADVDILDTAIALVMEEAQQ